MAPDFLFKVATVLEEAAKVIDTHTTEKTAAARDAHTRSVKELSARFAEATGGELPSDVAEKLASADKDVLATVSRLIENSGSPVETMGGSSEKTSGVRPLTKAERLQAAYDNFGSFITNS
jgi:hypothetical protein